MTLPGGAADKLGNRYEKWWTLSELVRMLQGKTEALRIEATDVDKTEFVVTTGRRRELHQAKRDHPKEKWSFAALDNDGLLEAIGRQLQDNNDRFVFVSASRAGELADLCEAARDAESADEFQRKFLQARVRQKNFNRLLKAWACDGDAALDRLRRIDVRTIDERELEQKVQWGLQTLFLGNPTPVADALRGIVEDSVHRTLTRQHLVDELSRRGYRLRQLTNPQSAAAAVHAVTDRYLSGARARLIRQRLVPREASQTLLARVNDAPTGSVLTGRAGSGKTGCVVELVEALRERGAPVLAFRLDRFVSARTTAHLGELLEVEESPALVLAAATEASGRTGVLVVDQLDAVSTASGRSAGAFEVVEQLLAEARGLHAQATIHVVVVCREFDWNHDHRLRPLMPESSGHVTVSEFSAEEVKKVLADAAFDPGEFQDRQLKILQLPQNLSLFLQAGFDTAHAPVFRTAKEIFDRYWDDKRRVTEQRVPAAAGQWMDVMETLCGEMTSAQQLSVPKEKLDAFSPGFVSQLASEGVITFDGHRYGFGHESFFDYVFARLFVRRPETVVAFLKASEQHLFRRAQVRQVLTYLREPPYADRYVTETRSLLSDERIRPHLKDIVFALLAEVTDPTEKEWTIWKEWIDPEIRAVEQGVRNPDKLSTLAWRRFFMSRPWFAEVDRRGLIENWLASENQRLADMAVNYLGAHQHHSPDRVAELLEPYADRRGVWRRRLRTFMQRTRSFSSRRFFDLFLRLVDNGALDVSQEEKENHGSVFNRFYTLRDNRAEWVPEALALVLRRRFAVIRAAGGNLLHSRLVGHNGTAAKAFLDSAANVPADFVKHLLPVVLDIADSPTISNSLPKHDAVWQVYVKSRYVSGEDACLLGLARALAARARDGDPTLDGVIATLRGRETHVANHLLMVLYNAGAERLANEAVKLLCDEPWRFQSTLFHYDDGCATAVIRATVPHCATESRERLEEVILRYVSPYEQTTKGYKQHGRTRLGLLSAFPEEMRSVRANRHLVELTRKFGEPPRESRRITDTRVKSPIDEAATVRMTDDQWLRAITKYPSEHRLVYSDKGSTGGVWELAGVLEARVREEPERFARLSLRFPAGANPTYLMRTLGALKDVAIPAELKLRVCRKALDNLPVRYGGSIAGVIGSVEDALPEDAIRMLDWFATGHDDPARELLQQDASGDQAHYGDDILRAGINTTRGQAAWAIRDLILRDEKYLERFRGTLDRMVHDPSATVRSCVAGTLRAVAFRDPALGLSLFLNMDMSEDRLLVTHDVHRFMHANLRDGFTALRPLVERMVRSSEPGVRQVGGRLAGVAALLHKSAADLASEALRGDAHGRRGVAEVASANVGDLEFRNWCEPRLAALFDDADADVRREAASCFTHLADETLDHYSDLIETFCNSRAFEDSNCALMNALEHSRKRLPGMTCAVCDKFCERLAGDNYAGRTEDLVAKLVFRTYQQHQHDEWTARALDLVDRLCMEGIPEAAMELEQFER